jgi:hypothetical protein
MIHAKIGRQLGNYLQANSVIQNVQASFRSVPMGWLGKLGDISLESHARLFESLRPRMCEDWDMEPFKYDLLTKSAISECKEFRSWTNYYYCLGQKSGGLKMTVPMITVQHMPPEQDAEPTSNGGIEYRPA